MVDVNFSYEVIKENGSGVESLCILNRQKRSMRKEICVQSDSKDSLTLYIDAKPEWNSPVGCVHIYYVTQNVSLKPQSTPIVGMQLPVFSFEGLIVGNAKFMIIWVQLIFLIQ